MDLAGLKAPAELEGRSFVPLLRDPLAEWPGVAFSQVARGDGRGESLRTGRWRYTEWRDGADGVELFDHRLDGDEYTNLADAPGFDVVLDELEPLLGTVFPDG